MRHEPSPAHFSPAQAAVGMLTELLAAGALLLVGLGLAALAWLVHAGAR